MYVYDILILGRKFNMAIQYKMDILVELKNKGYSSYRLRKEKIFGEATIQKMRKGELVSWENMTTLCELLQCQPGDIVEYCENESL